MCAQAVSIKEVINTLVAEQLPKRRSKKSLILESWAQIMPKKALPHANPVVVRNKTLIISVSNSAWLHELTLHKKQILENITASAGQDLVNDVRFKIGATGPAPHQRGTGQAL